MLQLAMLGRNLAEDLEFYRCNAIIYSSKIKNNEEVLVYNNGICIFGMRER